MTGFLILYCIKKKNSFYLLIVTEYILKIEIKANIRGEKPKTEKKTKFLHCCKRISFLLYMKFNIKSINFSLFLGSNFCNLVHVKTIRCCFIFIHTYQSLYRKKKKKHTHFSIYCLSLSKEQIKISIMHISNFIFI